MKRLADIAGVILAGGQSSRFGANKALAAVQGLPMIKRVLGVMQQVFKSLLIVTNTPEDYASFKIPVACDLKPYHGPLGGIVTAFNHTPHDRIFVVSCDMPLLTPGVIRWVINKGRRFDAGIPIHDGTEEYLMALYSRNLLFRMTACLEKGELSLHRFFRDLPGVVRVPIAGASWFNVNRQSQLEVLKDAVSG